MGQTGVLEVRAEITDSEQAATVANAYAKSYIGFRRDDVLAAELPAPIVVL